MEICRQWGTCWRRRWWCYPQSPTMTMQRWWLRILGTRTSWKSCWIPCVVSPGLTLPLLKFFRSYVLQLQAGIWVFSHSLEGEGFSHGKVRGGIRSLLCLKKTSPRGEKHIHKNSPCLQTEVEEDAIETVHSCQASQLGNIPDPTVKWGDFQDAASSHCCSSRLSGAWLWVAWLGRNTWVHSWHPLCCLLDILFWLSGEFLL